MSDEVWRGEVTSTLKNIQSEVGRCAKNMENLRDLNSKEHKSFSNDVSGLKTKIAVLENEYVNHFNYEDKKSNRQWAAITGIALLILGSAFFIIRSNL